MKTFNLKIGIPTMLMLLLSICLICFSLLSLTSSYSDYKLSNKLLARTYSYYEASNHAYLKMHELHDSSIDIQDNYVFQISDTEALSVVFDKNDSTKILSWTVISTSSDNYNEHLNVIP